MVWISPNGPRTGSPIFIVVETRILHGISLWTTLAVLTSTTNGAPQLKPLPGRKQYQQTLLNRLSAAVPSSLTHLQMHPTLHRVY